MKPDYESMIYNRCGRSGLKLPIISLGLWHNFGGYDAFENGRLLVRRAFELGVTHFDLANNYGPPPGSAEETFGRILKQDFSRRRDEMIISSKAGYGMWDGPYGDGGSRKYLVASLDQSLKRLGLDYVDIFYHHRPDSETPLEESMAALDHIVRQGKALYVGLSNYSPEQTRQAAAILKRLGTPFIIHQGRYNLFMREAEQGLFDALEETGVGYIAFSPLAQGMLTEKYLHGVPRDSRAANPHGYLKAEQITSDVRKKVETLHAIAEERGQCLAQMAIGWLLRDKRVTSVLVGARHVKQLEENVGALRQLTFTYEELDEIDTILRSARH